MIDFRYLQQGLRGMSRAPRANVMTGHLGAAVVAGYFVGEDQADLDPQVSTAIEKELERITHGEEKWFDPARTGITVPQLFEPYADEEPAPRQVAAIARALAGNIDKPRQSGHNVIFAAIALRALQDHPGLATPSVVEGIGKLIAGFDGAHPGRGYYGKERGWKSGNQVELPEDNDDEIPTWPDATAMATAILDALIDGAAIHRRGFGGLWHVINHTAALIELANYGYRDLARRGLPAHHRHFRLWQTLPDLGEELGPRQPVAHSPLTPEFWRGGDIQRDTARLTHRIKTLYGFAVVARAVEDEDKQAAAAEKLLYLM